MALNGFIKLHRKMLGWGWYGDPAVKAVFLHLLLSANFKDAEWNGVPLRAGQVATGIQKLACLLGLSVQQVRTALRKLETTNEITKASTNKYTLVTIVKWEDYQLDGETAASGAADEPQANRKRRTNGQQQRKKGKKEKNNIPPTAPQGTSDRFAAYAGEDEALQKALSDFDAMRVSQNKPLTDRARQMLLGKLDELAGEDAPLKVRLLEQSILNCWLSVFPLRDAAPAARPPKFLN